jgi:type I restriction enzyme R subunit
MFADPEFDGEPSLLEEVEIDEQGRPVAPPVVAEPDEPPYGEGEFGPAEPEYDDDLNPPRRKLHFDGGQVEIATHLVYELDPDGKQLRVVRFTDYTAEKVRTLYPSAIDLRRAWADPQGRGEIIARLADRGIDFEHLSAAANQPDADPFDLLCHLAFNAPLRTRRERAQRLRRERQEFFEQYSPEARAILDELLEKYAEHGVAQLVIPDILKLPPISAHGNVMEIAGLFGGADRLRDAVNQLQTLLYAA